MIQYVALLDLSMGRRNCLTLKNEQHVLHFCGLKYGKNDAAFSCFFSPFSKVQIAKKVLNGQFGPRYLFVGPPSQCLKHPTRTFQKLFY